MVGLSPLARRRGGSIVGPGSLPHVVIPGRNVSVTSWIFNGRRILSVHGHFGRRRAYLPRRGRAARRALPPLVGQALIDVPREVLGAPVAEEDRVALRWHRRAHP